MKVTSICLAVLLSAVFTTGCTAAEQQKTVATKPEVVKSVKTEVENTAEFKQAEQVKVAEDDTPELTSDGFPKPKQKKKLSAPPPPPADAMTPLERVKSAPVGALKNPYAHDLNNMAVWGQQRYMGNSCNGCHGGTGGGGMCPPLSNATWVYGNSDDTLFRLIALGSDELQKQLGVMRKGRENVVGPMPAFGGIIKTDDEIWRIISFIRTIYNDDPKGDARNVH